MPSRRVSVTLSLGNGSWQQTLPDALQRQGMLRRVLRFGSRLDVLESNGNGSLKLVKQHDLNWFDRLAWGLWRHLPGMGRSRLPLVVTTTLADRVASKWVTTGNVFHGRTGTCLASLKAAKNAGAVTIVEHPMPHPRRGQDEVLAECKRFEIRPRHCGSFLPGALIRRMDREYAVCDKIIVPSTPAKRSFEEHGFNGKVAVVLPGVDHQFFAPGIFPPQARLFRVCYVGRLELAKGIGYLLQAWCKLALPNSELVLIGERRRELRPILRRYALPNVRFTGILSAEDVAKWYKKSTVFVYPSVNEGFGRVILEAMASGLPVIATEGSGAEDCITRSLDGFVVPPRNVDSLAESILWCYRNPEDVQAMGKSARATIESRFTLSHYNERVTAVYESLIRKKNLNLDAINKL